MTTEEMMPKSGAQALVRTMKAFGVRHVFGLPGNQLPFYDAIVRDGTIQHVLVRHEQAAAHMADGYARATGRVGVCEASAGPGSSNLVTGLAEAMSSSIAVVAIATTSRAATSGRANFQELDLVGLFKPIVKRVLFVDRAARVPEFTKRAFRIATSGKPGPVVLVMPAEVHSEAATFSENDFRVAADEGGWPSHRMGPTSYLLAKTIELLQQAERPLIWAGGGIHSSGAQQALQQFAEVLGIPVTTTYMGKGAISEQHPLCVGPVGQIGRPSTNAFVAEADLVIAIGTRFTNLDTAGWKLPRAGAKIIHVDIDPDEIGRHFEVDVGIWSDARIFLEQLLPLCASIQWRSWPSAAQAGQASAQWRVERGPESEAAKRTDDGFVHPLAVIRALRRCMTPDDVIICDSGFNQIWGGQYFETTQTGRHYIGPRGMGVMGYAFPAAIAARLGDPSRRYVALCGDGGFMMLLHELETSLRLKAPVVVCILNNRNLEYCTQIQQGLGGQAISTTMLDTDFAQVAVSFGCRGVRVTATDQLESVLSEALASDVTTVVDIVTPDLLLPDGMKF